MPAPAEIVEHLRARGYHPRSPGHGRVLCEYVLEDLLASCLPIRDDARSGRLVYDVQRKIIVAGSEWNIDLVLGPPPYGSGTQPPKSGIRRSPPATIRIAIEAKAIMTEHGKARRNRQRDLDSFHQFVHRYDSDTVTAGVTVVNIAGRFRSPLRSEINIHRNVPALVQVTMSLLRSIPQRSARPAGAGLEANGVIVLSHDNVDSSATTLATSPPAPQVGDPLHYDTFLRRICDCYTQRWSVGAGR